MYLTNHQQYFVLFPGVTGCTLFSIWDYHLITDVSVALVILSLSQHWGRKRALFFKKAGSIVWWIDYKMASLFHFLILMPFVIRLCNLSHQKVKSISLFLESGHGYDLSKWQKCLCSCPKPKASKPLPSLHSLAPLPAPQDTWSKAILPSRGCLHQPKASQPLTGEYQLWQNHWQDQQIPQTWNKWLFWATEFGNGLLYNTTVARDKCSNCVLSVS